MKSFRWSFANPWPSNDPSFVALWLTNKMTKSTVRQYWRVMVSDCLTSIDIMHPRKASIVNL